jgi:tetratricopeptide (TPR) repeat protein
MLKPIVYVDLVGLGESTAQRTLIEGIRREPFIPKAPPAFPGFPSLFSNKPLRFPVTLPPFWNVPHRNTFFTGRDEYLERLYDALTSDSKKGPTREHVISGLSGMGKTQLAIEYAYRYHIHYQAILWVRADSQQALDAGYSKIDTEVLKLASDAHPPNSTINAVKDWLLNHPDWLIIFDDVTNPVLVKELIPPVHKGHILFTTMILQDIELNQMEEDEGAEFLLRRSEIIDKEATLASASEEDRIQAKEIARELAGLPLALDQAGAYILEHHHTLSYYLQLYRDYRAELLRERGNFPDSHKESVTTTLLLSYNKIEEKKANVAKLLQLCAFLYPDAIPREIFINGSPELGPELQELVKSPINLDKAIRELANFSLLGWRDKETYAMHRLVQDVLKDETMDETTWRMWAERVVRAINRLFPEEVGLDTWKICQRYLPQAQVCRNLIKQWNMHFPEAARLLDQVGCYLASHLQEHSQYALAESFCKEGLEIRQQILPPDDSRIAMSYYHLASIYRAQEHDQATSFFEKAKEIWQSLLEAAERNFGLEHPSCAHFHMLLAQLYRDREQYSEAEIFYNLALKIYQIMPEAGRHKADIQSELGHLHYIQGRDKEAKQSYEQVLILYEKERASDARIVLLLRKLAELYLFEQPDQAETLSKRELAAYRQILGSTHSQVVLCLYRLVALYEMQGKYDQSEPLYQQALKAREQALGLDHQDVADSLIKFAAFYRRILRYAQAEPLYQRALLILKHTLSEQDPVVINTAKDHADVLRNLNREPEAIEIETHLLPLLAKQQN